MNSCRSLSKFAGEQWDLGLSGLAGGLDWLRSRVLRSTLAHPGLRTLFCYRPLRLAGSFIIYTAIAWTAAVFVPLWVLILGPMTFGLPHLIASVRYTVRALESPDLNPGVYSRNRRSALVVFSLILVGLGIFRVVAELARSQGYTAMSSGFFPELIAVVLSALLIPIFFNRSWIKTLFGTALCLGGAWLAGRNLMLFTGVLVLLHNAVGFVYWFSLARTPEDRWAAVTCFILFCAVTGAIFLGASPGLSWFRTSESVSLFGLKNLQVAIDAETLGSEIATWTLSREVWVRTVVAYAFGQSIHYFVWLKAIPEASHSAEVPTSFRQSLRILQREFGGRYIKAASVLFLAGSSIWLLYSLAEARMLYLLGATYHSYLELVGIGFLKVRRS